MKKLYNILLSLLLVNSSITYVQIQATSDEITPEAYEAALQDIEVAEPSARGAVPNAAQLKYYDDETSAFIHFGINTFTGDEWSDGKRDPMLYAPESMDTDQWVKALKEAGFKKIIITAKHHDGFLLWPSEFSDYSVAHSGDKNKIDVLAELSRSCTEQNMDMGLYLSPWDRHEPSYGVPVDEYLNPTEEPDLNGDYNEYYLNQLKEVLEDPKYGNNGHFCELWMDGAKRGDAIQPYALQEWWEFTRQTEVGPDGIRGTADDVLLFNNIGEDVRWVGNESGYSYDPIWPQVNKTKLWNDYNYGIGGTPESPKPPVCNNGSCEPASYEDGTYLTKGQYDGDQWSMPESDFSIIGDWFYKVGKAPISGAEIAKRYFQTVGNATPMLLNTPPNKKGKLEESYVKSLKEYREILDNTFRTNMMDGASAVANSTRGNAKSYSANNVLDGNGDTYWSAAEGATTGDITVYLDGEKQFDVVDLKEYIKLGQSINQYNVEVRVNGEWQSFGLKNNTGSPDSTRKTMSTIGARSLIRGNTVIADAIRLNITGSYGVPMIKEMAAYKMDSRIEFSKGGTVVPASLKLKEAHSAKTTGTWNKEDSDTFRPNSMSSWDKNATATYTFTGSKFYLSSRHSWNFGAMEVSIDGQVPFLVDLYSTTLDTSVLVYESEDLAYGEHNVVLRPHTSPTSDKPEVVTIATDGLYYLDNEGKGMFELATTNMEVRETESVKLAVKRVGGSKGEAKIHVQTDPGSAVQGDAFEPINEIMTFADGESEKQITVNTLASIRPGDLDFFIKLSSPEAIGLGFSTRCTVTILNKDVVVNRDALKESIEQALLKKEENYNQKNWRGLQSAIKQAQRVMNDDAALQKEVDGAVAKLKREQSYYREENTYMNLYKNGTVSFEMEDGDLSGVATIFNKNDYSQFANASGFGLVGDVRLDGAVSIYFDAPVKGTYKLMVRSYAGSAGNQIQWSNEKTGALAIRGSMPAEAGVIGFGTSVINIEVKEAGMQYLKFMDWDTPATPNLDKIELTYQGKAPVLPTSISLDESDMQLQINDQKMLQATISPSDAIKELHWYSDDDSIARVNELGEVTALKEGTTTLHVVAAQNVHAQVTLTVKAAGLNTKELSTLIQEAEDIAEKDYTTDSQKNLKSAVDKAKMTLEAASEQSEIEEAVTILKAAMQALVSVVELNATIATANEIDANLYTEESYAVLTKALQDAQAVGSNGTKESVAAAVAAIQTAISQLVAKTTDLSVEKAVLASAIRKANDIIDNDLLDGLADKVVFNFTTCLEAAIAAYDSEDATSQTLLTAWFNLANAMHYLDFTADKTQLNALIQECDAIELKDYKDDANKATFKAALVEAKRVAGSQDVLDVSITKAVNDLMDARSKLVPKEELNTLMLEYMIARGEEALRNKALYDTNAASWCVFTGALANANLALKDMVSQAAIDDAVSQLAAAYEDIRLIANEDTLKQLVDFIHKVNTLNTANYSKSNMRIIKSIQEEVKELVEKKTFTMSEYKQAIANIAKAEAIIKNDTLTPVTTDDKNNTASQAGVSNHAAGVNTGDSMNVSLLMLMLFTTGGISFVLYKRRYEKRLAENSK